MDDDEFDDDDLEELIEQDDTDEDEYTYEDYDVGASPDDEDDDEDDEEGEYSFLLDIDPNSLAVGEIIELAESVDEDELNDEEQEVFDEIKALKEQIDLDQAVLQQLKNRLSTFRKKIIEEKTKTPDAKQRITKLNAYRSQLTGFQAPLKTIQTPELQHEGQQEVKNVSSLINAEILKAKIQMVGQGLWKLIVNTLPYSAIVIGIVLAVIAIGAIIFAIIMSVSSVAGAPYENCDVENGILNTSSGIAGDCFYGARFIYYDEEQAKLELETNYENLVVDLITKLDEVNGIDATIQLHYTEARPDQLTDMIKIVADQTDGSDEEFATISEHLALVDHFGYTSTELENIKTNLLDYCATNLDTIFSIDLSVYTADFAIDFEDIFDTNYSSLNVVTPLYFVQDVILENDDSTIKNMTKKNYLAMIYMPKKNVVIDETNFMFYIEDKTQNPNAPTNVKVDFIKREGNVDTVLARDVADSSWWEEDYAKEQTTPVENLAMTPFTSLDLTNDKIRNGASIYSLILKDDIIGIDMTIVDQLFSKENVSESEGNPDSYISIGYLPANEVSCYYLKLEADGEYQFCEFYTVYQKQDN